MKNVAYVKMAHPSRAQTLIETPKPFSGKFDTNVKFYVAPVSNFSYACETLPNGKEVWYQLAVI